MATTKKKSPAKKKTNTVASSKKSLSNKAIVMFSVVAVFIAAIAGLTFLTIQEKKGASAVSTPAEACGNGYTLQAQAYEPYNKSVLLQRFVNPNKQGTKYYYCNVLLKKHYYGTSTYTYLRVTPASNTANFTKREDAGNFRYFAGPIYTSKKCMVNGFTYNRAYTSQPQHGATGAELGTIGC